MWSQSEISLLSSFSLLSVSTIHILVPRSPYLASQINKRGPLSNEKLGGGLGTRLPPLIHTCTCTHTHTHTHTLSSSSTGFHVFPTFLWSEFSMIFFVTICVILLKVKPFTFEVPCDEVLKSFFVFLQFFLAVCVLGFFLGHCRSATLTLAFSLAQVSEFSFVLASRARRLDIMGL